MHASFILRDGDRGYSKFLSTGEASSYIGGHLDAILTRHSSLNPRCQRAGDH